MLADFLEEILVEAGYAVCGIAGTVAHAIQLGERLNPTLGVIDLQLGGREYGTDVGAALCRRGNFGALYATGNPDHPLLGNAVGAGWIAKPYSSALLIAALRAVETRITNPSFDPTLPNGFKLLRAIPAASS